MNAVFTFLFLVVFASCKGLPSGMAKEEAPAANKARTGMADRQTDSSEGDIYFSFDNGSSWENKSQGLPEDLALTDIAVGEDRLALATKQHGIFLFDFPRSKWVGLASRPPGGSPEALYVQDSHLFAGTQNGGVFLSKDEGKSWASINNGLGNLTIRKLAAYDNQLYAGTNAGLFSWDEKNHQWQLEYGGHSLQVNGIAATGDEIYIGTNQGAYKTSKHSRAWKAVLPNRSLHNIGSDGRAIYAMVYNELLVSHDKGLTWQSLQNGLPAELYSFQVRRKDNVVLVGQWDGVYKRAASDSPFAGWVPSSKGLSGTCAVTEMNVYQNIVVVGCSGRRLRKGATLNK